MLRHTFEIIFKFILLLNLIPRTSTNLFCNADFQTYTNLQYSGLCSYPIYFLLTKTDPCWYAEQGSNILIKKVGYFPTTTMSELTQMFKPYTLCQNIAVQKNKLYNFTFDIAMHPNMIQTNVSVYVNNKYIAHYTKNNNTKASFTSVKGQFKASSTNIKFCVNATRRTQFVITADSIGTFLDNFNMVKAFPTIINNTNTTLVNNTINNTNITVNNTNNTINNNISNTTNINSTNNTPSNIISDTSLNISESTNNNSYNMSDNFISSSQQHYNNSYIEFNYTYVSNSTNKTVNSSVFNPFNQICPRYIFHFKSEIDDQRGIIYISSIDVLQSAVCQFLAQHATIVIQGKVQKDVIFTQTPQHQLIITIQLKQPTNINNLKFQMGGLYHQDGRCYELVMDIIHKSVIFFPLPENQKNVISFAETVTNNTIGFFFDSYSQIRFFFVTYFVANFISFFNIIILYNFLFLQLQPPFSFNSLERLSQIYFNSNQSMIQIMINLLSKFNIQFSTNFDNFADTKDKQKIPQKLKAYIWFNSFGISYNFMKNSLTLFITFGLLIAKIIGFVLVRKIIRIFYEHVLVRSKRAYQFLITQLLCNSSSVSISAVSSFQKMGNQKFLQKINDIFQYSMFLIIIFLPFIYWMTSYRSFQKQSCKKQKSIDQQMKYKGKRLFKLFQYSLHILIPCLIVIKNKLSFFIIISVCLIILCILYFKHFCYLILYVKLYLGLTLFVLLIHHISFSFLFIASYQNEQTQIKLGLYLKIAGMLTIFTVLVGSIVELIDVFRELLLNLFKLLKFCIKKCSNKESVDYSVKQSEIQYSKSTLIPVQKTISNFDFKVQNYKSPISKISSIKQMNNLNSRTLTKVLFKRKKLLQTQSPFSKNF